MKLSGALQSLTQWYGQRPIRERIMLLVCLLVVLFFVWDAAVMNPIDLRKKRARKLTEEQRIELAQLTARKTILQARKEFDPDRDNRQSLSQLQADMADLQRQLEENVGNLISPTEMPELLKDLLSRQQNLQLLSLENLPAEALQVNEKTAEQQLQADLYRHRLRIEFAGDYLATLAYLKKLEELPRQLVWEELEIETQEYPRTKVSLQVYTLSLSRGWIGG